jgi:hypothetical protein
MLAEYISEECYLKVKIEHLEFADKFQIDGIHLIAPHPICSGQFRIEINDKVIKDGRVQCLGKAFVKDMNALLFIDEHKYVFKDVFITTFRSWTSPDNMNQIMLYNFTSNPPSKYTED